MPKKGNQGYHDRVAGKYDQIYDSAYWRFYRDVSWRHLQGFLPAGRPAWAADLGCGTGWFGKRLLRAGFHVLFLDPSQGMLEQSRAAAAEEDRRGLETRFVKAGLEDLRELADGTLDFATAQGDPLSFCEEPKRAIHELRRVLRPGACAVLSVDHRVAGVRSLLSQRTPDEALELLRSGRTEWRARREEEGFGMKMFLREELAGLLEKGGFEPRSWIAKTCLVQRANEAWLDDPEARRRLLAAEEGVHGTPEWFGVASHLQVAAIRL
jgi:SAM-dependent methyltransferase